MKCFNNRYALALSLVAIFVLHGMINRRREGMGYENAWRYGAPETTPHTRGRVRHPLSDRM